MAKRSKANADVLRKEIVRSERRRYLEGGDKSHTWDGLKEMARDKERLPRRTLDQEIELYMPLLTAQQKRALLALVNALVSNQTSNWKSLYKEQREAIKAVSAAKKNNC